MAFAIICIPLAMALAALAVPSNRLRPWLLPITGLVHTALVFAVLAAPSRRTAPAWMALDPAGLLVLVSVSVLYLACAFYTVGYLRYRQSRSNRVFCACVLALLGTMSLVAWSHHLGLLWVAMEATAVTAAPLIYFNRSTRSIEATWKYLLVGSIGIALAFLGTLFLAYSAHHAGLPASLTLEDLLARAPHLSKPWLHAAFVLLLVGYGTKMGLAPMHTWKPDAYGEAPGVVGAIFAGGITHCAFLALVRIHHVCRAAGEEAFCGRMLIGLGLLSMAVAGVFVIGQKDFKRMLAYSSVEHMGILAIGLGLGGAGIFGALLHLVNNTAVKGVLFLSAGNIHRAYDSKIAGAVAGAWRRLPVSGALFLAGFLAITGSPPFGPFVSEFAILNAALGTGHFAAGGLLLILLLVVFIGMGAVVLTVVQGRPTGAALATPYRDSGLTAWPALLLMGAVLGLGLALPEPLRALLNDAVRYLEVRP